MATKQKREVKIYCPKCSWEPEQSSRWHCTRCSHGWNTFETCATCPECGHTHEDTQCLSCHAHSKHREWYHDFTFETETEEDELVQPIAEVQSRSF